MYLTPTTRHWAADIEADDLKENVTRIWCVCLENIVSGEKLSFTDAKEFRTWQKRNPNAIYVGHNFLAYDTPVLNRLWGSRIPVGKVVDTFVLSQLYSPTFQGGHSLDVWGKRVRMPKMEHKDFSEFTPEMLKYCENDTSITAVIYKRLAARMREIGFTERGCELEHRAWHIIQNKQRKYGFPFDYKRAHELYVHLRQREEELKDEIYKLWPPYLGVVGEYKRAYRKDGTRSANYERHLEQFPKIEDDGRGGYRAFDWIEFNLGSPKQRIEKLLELGWEPRSFTKAGNPQVDEDSLLEYAETSGKSEVRALALWLVTNSRANMINTWLNAYNEKTGAIHGNLWIASTLRYRHNNPNSANIPAVRVSPEGVVLKGEAGAWAYECRDLWTCGAPDNFDLVGMDGKGLQLRILAEHVYRLVGEAAEPFIESVLTGDPHIRNMEVLGLPTKAAAKKFLYTTLMGGGGAKLAADQVQFGMKLSEADGNRLKNLLIDSIPGFGELIKKLKRQLDKTGRITLSDGTPILVPSDHMVIPYLLQGDESRLMKQAMIFVDEEVRRYKLTDEIRKAADIHDEWQYVSPIRYTKPFIKVALPCFLKSGESFGYRVPIEGDAKVGKTWAETH